jgi:hypothetical protein
LIGGPGSGRAARLGGRRYSKQADALEAPVLAAPDNPAPPPR